MSDTAAFILQAASHFHEGVDRDPDAYARMDPCELMQRICDEDRNALSELLTNRKLIPLDGRRVTLLEWIGSRVDHPGPGWGGGDLIVESAQDLLLDRFTRLPEHPDGGTDCRYYYQGFVNHLPSELAQVNGRRTLRQLQEVLRRFEGYVQRHWRFCLREAWRREHKWLVSHDYHNESQEIRFYVPACIPAFDRDDWLERNFGPIDSESAGRVQARIDAWMDHDLRDREHRLRADVARDPFGSDLNPFVLEHGWSLDGLAQTVAREKAGTPKRLRTSIAALGPERIGQLVMRIFSDVSAGCYHPSVVARDFGLHKSALTRFAAVHWRPGDAGLAPDLWLNTAQVLASQPCFHAVLQEEGLDHRVRALADSQSNDDGPPY